MQNFEFCTIRLCKPRLSCAGVWAELPQNDSLKSVERHGSREMLQTYEGGCHCGRVRFRIRVDLEQCTVGECNCSICTKKGILHIGVTPGQFDLLSGRDDLATYRFNTGIAQHTFCRHCGIHAFYVPRSDPENFSVNARCLDDFDPVQMRPRRFFDGRNWEDAFAGRTEEASRGYHSAGA
jgi:hypothetical protein